MSVVFVEAFSCPLAVGSVGSVLSFVRTFEDNEGFRLAICANSALGWVLLPGACYGTSQGALASAKSVGLSSDLGYVCLRGFGIMVVWTGSCLSIRLRPIAANGAVGHWLEVFWSHGVGDAMDWLDGFADRLLAHGWSVSFLWGGSP